MRPAGRALIARAPRSRPRPRHPRGFRRRAPGSSAAGAQARAARARAPRCAAAPSPLADAWCAGRAARPSVFFSTQPGGAGGDDDDDDEFDVTFDDEDFDFDDDYEYDSDEDAQLYEPKEVEPEMTASELAKLKKKFRKQLHLHMSHGGAGSTRRKKKGSLKGKKLLRWNYSVNHLQLSSKQSRHVRVPFYPQDEYLSGEDDDDDEDQVYFDSQAMGEDADGEGSNAMAETESPVDVDEELGQPADASVDSGDSNAEGELSAVFKNGSRRVHLDEVDRAVMEQLGMPYNWFDEKRERRAVKLALLKRRGKGPPKKGSGKRSKK